jgi:hypothetical protein
LLKHLDGEEFVASDIVCAHIESVQVGGVDDDQAARGYAQANSLADVFCTLSLFIDDDGAVAG